VAAWWEILGVEQDADLRTVKRAYAGKLKAIRQDENPAEFMELREAYDFAKVIIRHEKVPSQSATASQSENEDLQYRGDDDIGISYDYEPQPNIIQKLLEQAETILDEKTRRGDLEEWQRLFDGLDVFDVDDYTQFENALLYLLGQRSQRIVAEETRRSRRGYTIRPKIMSRETSQYIFDYFSWNARQHYAFYSKDMQSLRTLLHAHTEESRAALAESANAQRPRQQQQNEDVNPISIIFMVLGGLALLRIILSALGVEV